MSGPLKDNRGGTTVLVSSPFLQNDILEGGDFILYIYNHEKT